MDNNIHPVSDADHAFVWPIWTMEQSAVLLAWNPFDADSDHFADADDYPIQSKPWFDCVVASVLDAVVWDVLTTLTQG